MDALDMADQLTEQGKFSEAIRFLEEFHLAHPEEESVLLKLAWAYYDSGVTAKAIEYLEILLARELQRKIFAGFAFDELVRIYREQNNFSKLVEICARVVTCQPEDKGFLIELGNAYLQAGRSQDACRIFGKLIQLENDNPAFYCLLGKALFAAGLPSDGEAAYLRASEIDSDQVDDYFFKIADLFAQNGCYLEARRLLQKCIAVNPSKAVYHCCLGDTLVALGRVVEAQAEYETAAHCDNSSSGAYYNRFGNTLARANYHSEAVEAFKKALKVEPDNPVYTRHLAISSETLASMDMAEDAGKNLE